MHTQEVNVEKIKRIVQEGHFDYSKPSIAFFVLWTGAAGWLAYESAKLYLTLGADGTKYLPPAGYFEDKTELGQQSAFYCNFILNWYFMVSTIMDFRTAYLNFQARRKLDAPIKQSEMALGAIKLLLSVAMATTTGIIFAQIAGKDSDLPLSNQIITGGVNILLNFLGSMALFDYAGKIFQKLNCCCPAEKDYEQKTVEQDLSNEYDQHAKRPNDHFTGQTASMGGLAPLAESISLAATPHESKNRLTSLLKKAPYFIFWLGMQTSSGISLVGYLYDTTANIGGQFEIENPKNTWLVGCLFFATFAGLAIKLAHETVNETTGLTKTGWNKIVDIKENGIQLNTAESKKSAAINTVTGLLAITSYFFSYVSSNSSLDLNAKYDYQQLWNIIPTCIGATVFNGFAFLMIFIAASSAAEKYIVYSKDKRNHLDHIQKTLSFIKANPDILKKIPTDTYDMRITAF